MDDSVINLLKAIVLILLIVILAFFACCICGPCVVVGITGKAVYDAATDVEPDYTHTLRRKTYRPATEPTPEPESESGGPDWWDDVIAVPEYESEPYPELAQALEADRAEEALLRQRLTDYLAESRKPFEVCLAWGKRDTFVNRRFKQYQRFRDKGHTEDETRKEAVRTCSFRAGTPEAMPLCEACLEAVVDEVFSEKRVTVLDGKAAIKDDDDSFQACRKWGKSSKYVKKLSEDYMVIKDAGLSKNEILRSSLDSCVERVTDSDQLPACRACMTAIVDDLFKK